MHPAAEEMTAALKAIEFKRPSTSVVSNVTAQPVRLYPKQYFCRFNEIFHCTSNSHSLLPPSKQILNENDISELLVQQITGTVQWHDSITYLREQEGVSDFLCVGPGKVLANLLKKEYPQDNIQ